MRFFLFVCIFLFYFSATADDMTQNFFTKKIFTVGENVIVNVANIPSSDNEWIGIYNLTNNQLLFWGYTKGVKTGEIKFGSTNRYPSEYGTILKEGKYQARLFSSNSPIVIDRVSFIVKKGSTWRKLNTKLGEMISIKKLERSTSRKKRLDIYNKNIQCEIYNNIYEYVEADNKKKIVMKINTVGNKKSIKTEFSILDKDIKQVTITLLSNISWILPQVYKKNTDAKSWPNDPIQGFSIKSKSKIVRALDVNTKKTLPITFYKNVYSINIPSFEFTKFIQVDYVSNDYGFKKNFPILDWSDASLINGYTALPAAYYYKPIKLDDSFFNAEKVMKELGFSQYTRMVKGGTGHFSMMWNTLAIKDTFNRYPYRDVEDSVSSMSKRAFTRGLNFIAYYKDMGDSEVLKIHPEWECKTPDGDLTHPSFVMMDYTTPWKNVVKNQLIELAERGVKGIYFDFIHSPQWGCYGSTMQRLFEEETGLETPQKNNQGHHWSNHENWGAYMDFQGKKLAEVFSYWKDALKTNYPDFQFIISSTYVSGLTSAMHSFSIAEVADMVKIEFDHGRKKGLRHSVFDKDRKDDHNLAKPSDSILMMLAHLVPRDFSQKERFHSWAYGFANTDQLKGFIASSLALGGVPDIYIAEQYLRSDFNPDKYTPIFEAQTPYGSLHESIQFGNGLAKAIRTKKPLKFAGVYFDESTRNSYKIDYEAAWRNVIWPSVGAYESFLLEGMPVTAVNKNTIFKYIDHFSVLYLPIDEYTLPLDIQQLLVNYEDAGGIIIRRDNALEWGSISENKNVYTAFRKKISKYKQESLFWVDKDQSLGSKMAYPFFYQ